MARLEWGVEVSVEEETSRFLTTWQPGPAAMRLCLLRRVNASSATHLSLPLVGRYGGAGACYGG